MLTKTKRALWVVAGSFSLFIGILGIVLPLVPTTPLLLLTAYCYARGSERFHHWLLHNRVCGQYIRDYQEGRGIPMRTKIWTMVFLWGTIGFSMYLVNILHVRLLLPVIALAVSIHVCTRPTRVD
jgi:uncharacterized protein